MGPSARKAAEIAARLSTSSLGSDSYVTCRHLMLYAASYITTADTTPAHHEIRMITVWDGFF
jgi:hypothetical protein